MFVYVCVWSLVEVFLSPEMITLQSNLNCFWILFDFSFRKSIYLNRDFRCCTWRSPGSSGKKEHLSGVGLMQTQKWKQWQIEKKIKKWNSALSYLSSSPWAKGRKRHSKASLESQNHQQIFVIQRKVITLIIRRRWIKNIKKI